MQNSELLTDIKQVLDISSRVDERVKIIQQNQQEMNARLNAFMIEFNTLSGRVMVLESKNGGRVHDIEDSITRLASRVERIDAAGTEAFQKVFADNKKDNDESEDELHSLKRRVDTLEHNNDNWQTKIRQYGGLVVQGAWVVIMSYILFKLGLQNSKP